MNKLREAAQAVVKAYEDGECWNDFEAAVDALRDALAEPEPEYQLVGRFTGTLSGRFIFAPESNEIWPVGTALYAKTARGNT